MRAGPLPQRVPSPPCAWLSACTPRTPCRPIFQEEVEIADVAKTLWDAPFAVLMHEVEVGAVGRARVGA